METNKEPEQWQIEMANRAKRGLSFILPKLLHPKFLTQVPAMARPLLHGLESKVSEFFLGYILIDADQDRPRTHGEAYKAAMELSKCFEWIAGELHGTDQSARSANPGGEDGRGENGSGA